MPQNVNVALVEPGTMYGDRLNQVDLRVAKILKFGKTRTAVNLDLFNAFNRNTALDRQQQLRQLAAAAVDPAGAAGQDQRPVRLLEPGIEANKEEQGEAGRRQHMRRRQGPGGTRRAQRAREGARRLCSCSCWR